MEDNKQFYDLYGYHFNPLDVNNWMLYQQAYINFPSFDIYHGNIGVSYGNMTMPNNFNQPYLQNTSNTIGTIIHKGKPNITAANRNENIKYRKSNNTYEVQNRSEKSARSNSENYVVRENNNTTKTESRQIHTVSNKTFEILNRNKKGDDEKFRKNFGPPSKIDFDKDFPPISGCIKTEHLFDTDRSMDFKLALQKPKSLPVVEIKEEESLKVDVEISQEKVKKRKRNRRKKKVDKKIEPFAYVDEEFPTLNAIKSEDKSADEADSTVENEIVKLNKVMTPIDKKKNKKRKLLLILPRDMEGQVRVIETPKVQKNKTKRKVNQERMKRPISVLNPLDLSGPSVKRGKERLKPKVKKPSKLKKTILHYRILKKEMREKIKNELTDESNTEKTPVLTSEIDIVGKKSENFASKIHSKNFREYCNHMIDNKINDILSQLLKTLIGFQDKLYNRDPLKAKLKRRLCFGLREVTKFLNMKKLRLIIIAPDLEKIDIEGGLDDIVNVIIKTAREFGIPCVFGLSRSSLAYLCYKKFRVGAIGVFNYDGAEAQVKELLTSVDQAKDQYNQIKQIMESISQDVSVFPQSTGPNNTYFSSTRSDFTTYYNSYVPFNAGHSRTPSNALSEPISDIADMNKLLFNSIIEDQSKGTNAQSEVEDHEVKSEEQYNEEDNEDKLIDKFVENILHSVSRLSFHDDNL